VASLTFDKQGVALTGRNRTGPPYSVDRPRGGTPSSVPTLRFSLAAAALQTIASKTILAH